MRTCLALDDRHHTIDRNVGQHVRATAEPLDFDPVNLVVLSQAEVQSRPEMALVATTTVDLVCTAPGLRP